MGSFVALLRAVNLGSHNKIGMADLRALFSDLGLADPRSLIQSGNIVFGAPRRSSAALERLLETEAARRLDLHTDFFVRGAMEWKAIVDANPFSEEAGRDPGHLVVVCLKDPPSADVVRALQAGIKGREVVRASGRQAYVVYPDGIGTSRLTMAVLEKKLGTRGTGRNWNTVLKLHALAGA